MAQADFAPNRLRGMRPIAAEDDHGPAEPGDIRGYFGPVQLDQKLRPISKPITDSDAVGLPWKSSR